MPVEPAPGCGSRAFATSEEADAAGCGELVEIDLAPLEHVAGTSEIFSAGFGVELGAASDAGALRARYLSDRASLDRLRGLPEAELPPEMKAAYEREFDAVYGPREAALRATLGADYAPVVPSTSPSLPARPRFAFRAVADGGFDGAQLSYTGSGSGAVLASGYGGLTLALPQIPAPNVGLSVRARFASGPDWSRFQIGAGIQFIADVPPAGAGIDIGLHASYGYFLSANCDDPEGDAACGELTNIVATSDGGADIRASVDYEYLVARVLLLTAGGDVGFAFYPYTRPNGEGDVAKGLVFGLHAGLGLGL